MSWFRILADFQGTAFGHGELRNPQEPGQTQPRGPSPSSRCHSPPLCPFLLHPSDTATLHPRGGKESPVSRAQHPQKRSRWSPSVAFPLPCHHRVGEDRPVAFTVLDAFSHSSYSDFPCGEREIVVADSTSLYRSLLNVVVFSFLVLRCRHSNHTHVACVPELGGWGDRMSGVETGPTWNTGSKKETSPGLSRGRVTAVTAWCSEGGWSYIFSLPGREAAYSFSSSILSF